MKKKVLALILGLAMVMTTVVYADMRTPGKGVNDAEAQVAEPSVSSDAEDAELDDASEDEESGDEFLDAELDDGTGDTLTENAEGESSEGASSEEEELSEEPGDESSEGASSDEEENGESGDESSGEAPSNEDELTGDETAGETPSDENEPSDEEPADEPEDEPKGDAEESDKETVFNASIRIELKNQGQLYYGDEVTLRAIIEDANAEYTVRWEYYDLEASIEAKADIWVKCADEEKYTFTVDEKNAALTYRVVVNELISETYQLPTVLEREEETESPDEGEGTGEDDLTDVPGLEENDGLEEEPDGETDQESEMEAPEEPVENEAEDGGEAEQPAPALNPDRSIEMLAYWGEGDLHFGDACVLTAVLRGYDNAVYTLQWQTSKDGVNWVDVEGATEESYTMTVTEENYLDYWHVVVTVKELLAEENEQ